MRKSTLLLVASLFLATNAFAATSKETDQKQTVPLPSGGKVVATTGAPKPNASITMTCSDGHAFKLSTGTKTGTCVVHDNTPSGRSAVCNGTDGTQLAVAFCDVGCRLTQDTGSCSSVK